MIWPMSLELTYATSIEISRNSKNKVSFAVSAQTKEAIGRYNDNLDNWAYR